MQISTRRLASGEKATHIAYGPSHDPVLCGHVARWHQPNYGRWVIGYSAPGGKGNFRFINARTRKRAAQLHGLCVLALTQGGAFPEGDL